MINFNLTKEQLTLKKLAHDFAKNEIRPQCKFFDNTSNWPNEILQKAWSLGLMNFQIPQTYNGSELNNINSAIVTEEIGWGCSGIATAMTANLLAQTPIILFGNNKQKQKWLTPFSKQHIICSYAVTEPSAGSDVAQLKTTAIKKNDHYLLNGEKIWITGAGYAKWFIVLAKTNATTTSHKSLSAFIVPNNLTGITIGKKEDNMGQRASDTRSILFNNVKIKHDNLLGKEGDGFKIAMQTFNHTRPLVSASAIGLAKSAMEYSIKYAKERKTFGKFLYQHQSISFMIADMSSNIEAGRLLTWKAAAILDQNKNNTIYAAHAKRFCADITMQINRSEEHTQ